MRVFEAALTLLALVLTFGCSAHGQSGSPSTTEAPAAPSSASSAAATSGEAPADSAADIESELRQNPGRALLVRGTYAFRGLPHFPPNAVPGLAGEYLLAAPPVGPDSAAAGTADLSLRVWYTREPLVFGDRWKSGKLGPYTSYELRPDATSMLFLAIASDGHELFLELPRDLPELRSFAVALERKFDQFFVGASSDADLSFPAFVDIPR